MSEQERFGESAEMYLKTIQELTATAELIPISQLAERLGISNVSATEMVHRMKDQKLVEHRPYKGIRLTKRGRVQAQRIVRSHRLWERFLADQLGLAWEDVHDLACELEHASDPRVTEALSSLLGDPQTCPHGNPIPDVRGRAPTDIGQPLDSLHEKESAIVLRVQPESRSLLVYLAAHGIRPGARIKVLSIDQYDGIWTIAVNQKQEMISNSIAKRVIVEKQLEPLAK